MGSVWIVNMALSLVCQDCKAQLRSVQEMQHHSDATGHTNFAESTEAVSHALPIYYHLSNLQLSLAFLKFLVHIVVNLCRSHIIILSAESKEGHRQSHIYHVSVLCQHALQKGTELLTLLHSGQPSLSSPLLCMLTQKGTRDRVLFLISQVWQFDSSSFSSSSHSWFLKVLRPCPFTTIYSCNLHLITFHQYKRDRWHSSHHTSQLNVWL